MIEVVLQPVVHARHDVVVGLAVGGRIPDEKIWQIAAYVRSLSTAAK